MLYACLAKMKLNIKEGSNKVKQGQTRTIAVSCLYFCNRLFCLRKTVHLIAFCFPFGAQTPKETYACQRLEHKIRSTLQCKYHILKEKYLMQMNLNRCLINSVITVSVHIINNVNVSTVNLRTTTVEV